MRRFLLLYFFAACLVFASSVFAGGALAQTGQQPAQGTADCDKLNRDFEEFTGGKAPGVITGSCTNAGGVISRVTTIALALAGSVAVLFIIIGGFKYMTAGGNEMQAQAGKRTIMWASIGLGAILLAATLVAIVSRLVIGGSIF